MSDQLNGQMKEVRASEVIGYAVVVAHNLPHLAGILNEMRCDGAKSVEIKHIHGQQGKLAGQVELHVLVYAEEKCGSPATPFVPKIV